MHRDHQHKTFDELFADSANMQEFPMDENAWLDMAARLDRRDRKRRWMWFMLLFLVIGSGLWLMSTRDSTEKMGDSTSPIIAQTNITVEENATATSLTLLKQDVNELSSTTQEKIVQNQQPKKRNGVANSEVKTQGQYLSKDRSKPNVSVSQSTLTSTKSDLASNTRQPITEIEYIRTRTNELAKHRDISVTKVVAPQPNDKKRIGITLHAAPEWSSAGWTATPTLAWRVGTSLAYSITSKWELSVGLAYSKKLYSGSGDAYSNAEGWIDDISPRSMKAKCYVVDVPIMARKYLNDRNKNGFYVEGGLSNYFIRSEWYGFDYKMEDRQFLLARGVQPIEEITIDQSNNHHWVGVSQLSVGYQYKLNDSYYLSIAPYVSIPFTGIGEGKVKLYSSGIRFAARFQR